MRPVIGLTTGPVLGFFLATSAPADTVAPGAAERSLSGRSGDPEAGALIMDKGAGTCIACHQVSRLAHLQWHGEMGPSLDGVADRWSQAEIRSILAEPRRCSRDR